MRPGGLFARGQIRLAELSVFNWGSFAGLHTAQIDRQGTLITGDNGAGKSTLVDGLMALLLPAGRAVFNVAAAQGDRADRSLMSYIRGSYGSGHDGAGTQTLNKRKGAVVSALRGMFRAEDGSECTLAALMWTTQPGSALADLKRIYIVARRDLTLEEVLKAFGETDARRLKQALKADSAISVFDDHFAEYEEYWRRLLHIENRNAPALLGRALGLKKVEDLTALIRELVLEPSGVREQARKAVEEFADLVATHRQLVDARRRRDMLIPLPAVSAALERLDTQLAGCQAQQDALGPFVAAQAAVLWARRVDSLKERLAAVDRELERLDGEIAAGNRRSEQRHEAYLAAGGARIETLERELEAARRSLAEVANAAGQYQQLARGLGLDDALEREVFETTRARACERLDGAEAHREAAQDTLMSAGAARIELENRRKALKDEAEALAQRPDSNIDLRYQKLRDEMVSALGFDEGALVFIGELVDVEDAHKPWQGAIERALGGLRQTLVVPGSEYPLVTRWLNSRHTGLHVRAQVAGQAGREPAKFLEDGYLRKLKWRVHPYRDWLKRHLARFDLHCVADTTELDRTVYSMTREGLIHLAHGRFEKKDQTEINDRRHWNLGFSNRERLALARTDLEGLATEMANREQAVKEAKTELERLQQQTQALELLVGIEWSRIDVPHRQRAVETLGADLARLRDADDDLNAAKRLWDEARQHVQSLSAERSNVAERRGGVNEALNTAERSRAAAASAAESEFPETVRAALKKRVGALEDSQLDHVTAIEVRHREALLRETKSAERERTSNTNTASATMASFRTQWPVIAAEWGGTVADLGDYLAHLAELEQDGLPALVEEFRERLNRHTTQSLAGIRSRLDNERDEISERIHTINQVLERTEFRAGSHLKLSSRSEALPHVQDFNRRLTRVLGEADSDDSEARYAHLKEVIEMLDKASTPDGARTVQGRSLLDPRYQLSFFAEELDAETSEVRDVLASSSGKSGGEKEAFAGTVIAASLAYVLTPDGHDRPVYCTVFLDEAFSNTAEAVSRRVLRVFHALNIHVNLITPYKNLNLARESARSLLIAERDAATHESRLCEVTWEEIDARLEARRREALEAQTARLGIEIETVQ